MSNSIFNTIVEEKINNFIFSFKTTSEKIFVKNGKVSNPTEYGAYRENVVKDFIKLFIPQKVDIESGFIITITDKKSSQCDIIIYDKGITPYVQSNKLERFFPIETVFAVGEVKSTLSKKQFFNSLLTLSKIKKLRRDWLPNIMTNYGREFISNPNILRDLGKSIFERENNIFTFLICNKLNFIINNIGPEIDEFYNKEAIDHTCRHNIVLSLNDGLIGYSHKDNESNLFHYFPFWEGVFNNSGTLRIDPERPNNHIKMFIHFLFQELRKIQTVEPDMLHYFSNLFDYH